MEGIASAIRAGRLSFAFLETALYRRWAVRTGPTYQQVSQETGVPLELLASALEAMGFAPMTPEESITEDELEVVPLLQRGLASGLLDLAWFTQVGRAHAVGLRLIVTAGLVETAMGRHDDALGHLREARALAGAVRPRRARRPVPGAAGHPGPGAGPAGGGPGPVG